jgi:sRNA-binding regulator protein Hfq
MPMTRPHDMDGSSANGRRTFRAFTDYKRTKPPYTGHGNGNGNGRTQTKTPPPEATGAENFYYLKQMSSRTPMVIVLTDGEEVQGWIEWYDKTCLKVNRDHAPNLLIQKHCIKYLFKQEEMEPA